MPGSILRSNELMVIRFLSRKIEPKPRSLLDLGCGKGLLGFMSLDLDYLGRRVGVDLDNGRLGFCREHRIYDELFRLDLNSILPFRDKEFDVAVSLEVLEHLLKLKSEEMLAEMERVAKFVIVSTPTYFFRAGYGLGEHKCLWTIRELRERGYTVRGTGGFQLFGHELRFLSYALNGLTYPVPELSMAMCAYRKC